MSQGQQHKRKSGRQKRDNGQQPESPPKQHQKLDRSASLDSLQSLPSNLRDDDRWLEVSGLTAEYGNFNKPFGEQVPDCVVFLVYCTQHNKFLLSKMDRAKCLWLPFVPVKSGETWKSACDSGVLHLLFHNAMDPFRGKLGKTKELTIRQLSILRVQIPETGKFAMRIIHEVKVNGSFGYFKCCETRNPKLVWLPIKEIPHGVPFYTKMYGAEPFILEPIMLGHADNFDVMQEFTMEDALRYSKNENQQDKFKALLASAGFVGKDCVRLFHEWLEHLYPSFTLTFPSFVRFCEKLKLKFEWVRLFNCFALYGKIFISFKELLLGLAAIDPHCSNGGAIGEIRGGYVFRYYDSGRNKVLNYKDIKIMTQDIMGKGAKVEDAVIEKAAKQRWHLLHSAEFMKKYQLKSTEDPVPEKLFLEAVGRLIFRGTSSLCRSKKSVKEVLRGGELATVKSGHGSEVASAVTTTHRDPLILRHSYRGVCPGCKVRKYDLTTHIVTLNERGMISAPVKLDVHGNTTKAKKFGSSVEGRSMSKEALRRHSEETIFNISSIPNIAMDFVFRINQKRRHAKIPPSLPDDHKKYHDLSGDKGYMLKLIFDICKRAEEMFKHELRVVRATSPAFVIGDIHGNIRDLMIYESALWPKGPWASSETYVFVGNYVDQGDWGIECTLYLLSCKLIAPDKFIMIRGNHEVREIQKQFNFQAECRGKYGEEDGIKVWNAFNRVFDLMPLAAVINDTVFVAHGGIPLSELRIDQILKIQTPLRDPEKENKAAYEMLWNDPVDKSELEKMEGHHQKIEGGQFIKNFKRGNGYLFTEEAVQEFLENNGLTTVIRGHEAVPQGFKIHFNGTCITIFSCSDYLGQRNLSAVLFIDNEKMTICRIDTTELV